MPNQVEFSVDVKTSNAPPSGFQGYQIVLQYSGMLSLQNQPGLGENRWAPCAGNGFESNTPPTTTQPGRYVIGCKAGPPPRTYKGVLANVHFICKAAGMSQVSIIGGGGADVSFYERPSIYGNRIFLPSDAKDVRLNHVLKNVADSVSIRCGEGLR